MMIVIALDVPPITAYTRHKPVVTNWLNVSSYLKKDDHLRQHGLDDRVIHDATQVISYFNYINRVADTLRVEPEEFVRLWEQSPDKL